MKTSLSQPVDSGLKNVQRRVISAAINQSALVLLVVVLLVFKGLSPDFLNPNNLLNIANNSSAILILAVGMAFVLLTTGVDLSVGSSMYLGGAVAGTLLIQGFPLPVGILVFIVCTLLVSAVNSLFIIHFRIVAFITTLGMLYAARGIGHLVTETRAMNLPESFQLLASGRLLGIPAPIWIAGATLLAAHLILNGTPWGRQIYAVGHDARAARIAGVQVNRILLLCYMLCGCCVALSGLITLSQLGSVSPNFGFESEFSAIAAAVLGGVSLFGGRGRVFPGVLIGAVLLQTIESGLVSINADPYLYPVINGCIIFLAVCIDTMRNHFAPQLNHE